MKVFLIGLAIVVVGFPILLGLYGLGVYNGLVRQNEQVTNSWAQVETQYQRRFDLIPNLVNATKGFLAQEQKVFGDIAEARTRYAGTQAGSNERVEATNRLESALARLLVIVENYPQLQSNQTVQALMDELAGTENRINVARQRYNDQVQSYNVAIKVFPRSIIAGIGGFQEKLFFKSTEDASKAPTVDLEVK